MSTGREYTRRVVKEGARLRWELLPVSVAVPYVTAIEAHAATGPGMSTAVAYGVVAAVATGVAGLGAEKKSADAVVAGGTVATAAAWASWQSALGPSVAGIVSAALGVGLCGIPYWRYLAARRDETKRDNVKIEIERMKFEKWLEARPGDAEIVDAEIVPDPQGPADPWPGTRVGAVPTTAPIPIGADVAIPLEGGHVKVGGITGAGKSCTMHVVMCELLARDDLAIVGIDCKPGAPEMGRYRHAGVKVVTSAKDAAEALGGLCQVMERRGEVIARRTREAMASETGELPESVWVPTSAEPWYVCVVDEVTELAGSDAMQHLDRLSRLSRSYGITLIVMTQSVEAAVFSVPGRSGGGSRAQYGTSVCLHVDTEAEAEKILGTRCIAGGWDPTKLPLEGYMLVKGPGNTQPVRRRGYFIENPRTVQHIRMVAKARGLTPAIEAPAEEAVEAAAEAFVPEQRKGATVGERILGYLAEHGESRAREIAESTGDAIPVVRATLKTLKDSGRIEGDGAGKFWPARVKTNVLPFPRA